MGWERRRRGSFYYRSTRLGSRVKKSYFGNGSLAVPVAHQDERRKAHRGAATDRHREARQHLEAVDQELDQVEILVDVIAATEQEIDNAMD